MLIDRPIIFFLGIFLLTSIYFSGCTHEKVPPNQHVLETVIVTPPTDYPHKTYTHIGETPTLSYSDGSALCPIPPLIFNNSQDFTTLHVGLHILQPGEYPPSDAFSIPYGSIIYHSSGAVTRIFDPSGKQILIVNDSESSVLTNTGYDAATAFMPDFLSPDFQMNITRIGTGDVRYYINEKEPHNPCALVIVYSGWQNPFFPGNLGSKVTNQIFQR